MKKVTRSEVPKSYKNIIWSFFIIKKKRKNLMETLTEITPLSGGMKPKTPSA